MAITREWNRHQFFMAQEIINKLIEFAKQHHSSFVEMPEAMMRKMFELYEDTILIYKVNDEIRGFALYQEWPDCLNFICIVGQSDNREENLKAMLLGRHKLPAKKIVYYDEAQKSLRTIKCLQPQ
jgi:hypothetical protein